LPKKKVLSAQELAPAAKLLSRHLVGTDKTTGITTVCYAASAEFTNRHGTVQGGFLSAMLDSASALALIESSPPDRTAVTKRLIVDFENPAVPGTLIATARVTESAERSATVVGELRNSDGVIVARARAELRIIAASR
jgi:uncharacterized protein (TIGR00369 family)